MNASKPNFPSREAIRKEKTKRGLASCLWPPRYVPCEEIRDDSGAVTREAVTEHDALCRFLFECCWTDNEEDGLIELIPAHEYIRWAAWEWLKAKRTGDVAIIEKSRRLIISWVCRGMELWAMGLKRSKFVICGLTYPKSAEHVWRIAWLCRELSERGFKFGYDPKICERNGSFASKELGLVILPNGSIIRTMNQQGGKFQGSGYTGVIMEEFSQYDHPEYMYGQARRVTGGKPGLPGGFVVAITNAWPGTEWKGIKALA